MLLQTVYFSEVEILREVKCLIPLWRPSICLSVHLSFILSIRRAWNNTTIQFFLFKIFYCHFIDADSSLEKRQDILDFLLHFLIFSSFRVTWADHHVTDDLIYFCVIFVLSFLFSFFFSVIDRKKDDKTCFNAETNDFDQQTLLVKIYNRSSSNSKRIGNTGLGNGHSYVMLG